VNRKTTNKTALQEKAGVSKQEATSQQAISNLKKKRQEQPSIDDLLEEIIAENTAALSRGITLIESQNSAHKDKANKLIQNCLEHRKPSIRIGITGVPGVGKSTFIEALGTYLTGLGKKVAVLAVDPTSRWATKPVWKLWLKIQMRLSVLQQLGRLWAAWHGTPEKPSHFVKLRDTMLF
jgi:LAO/AO transport system kinase